MDTEYTHIRVWRKTLKLLRLLHAYTDETILQIVHRLAEQEVKRIQQEQQDGQAKHDA